MPIAAPGEEDQAVVSSKTNPLIGSRLLDRYLVEQMIGQGGMSVVYRAHDSRLDRPVAVKFFSKLLARDARIERVVYEHFVQEAFALSQLKHPNTLRIYDLHCLVDPQPFAAFQVAEYMEGGTLAGLVQRHGPMPPSDALAILEAIGGALAEAHSHDIVHRDVKPSNILFGSAGRHRVIKLADFSVALASRRSPTNKAPGQNNGPRLAEIADSSAICFYSLGWSAPEQVRGEDVDSTADVYALGLTLGFMLTGLRLRDLRSKADFGRPVAELDSMLAQAIHEAGLSEPFASLCMRACRASPGDRYSSVDDLVRAMSNAAQARPDAPIRRHPFDESRPGIDHSDLQTIRRRDVFRASGVDHAGPQGLAHAEGHRQARAKADRNAHQSIRAQGHSDIEIDIDIDGPAGAHFEALDRCVRLIPADDWIDLATMNGCGVGLLFLPSSTERSSVQVRGRNCFLRRPGGQPTRGLSLDEDADVALLGVDRTPQGLLRVRLGAEARDERLFSLPSLRLSLPTRGLRDAVCLEFEGEPDLILAFRRR